MDGPDYLNLKFERFLIDETPKQRAARRRKWARAGLAVST